MVKTYIFRKLSFTPHRERRKQPHAQHRREAGISYSSTIWHLIDTSNVCKKVFIWFRILIEKLKKYIREAVHENRVYSRQETSMTQLKQTQTRKPQLGHLGRSISYIQLFILFLMQLRKYGAGSNPVLQY
jgi:hypothetical protein